MMMGGRIGLLEQDGERLNATLSMFLVQSEPAASCSLAADPHSLDPRHAQGQEEMSKSDPNSAIFMEDSEVEVNTKIKKAY